MMAFYSLGSAVAACLVVFIVFAKVAIFIADYHFAKWKGCKQPIKLPQQERIIGYKHFTNLVTLSKTKSFLPTSLDWHRETGNTYSIVILGEKSIVTIEPENIKAMLASNFTDFGVGERIKAMGALLGQGIFTSDGFRWEHSRALIRPNFVKSQVADLDTFETHIQHLIAKIPQDGSPIDLQPLFFQLTLDSATEFLFGESVDVLRSPAGSEQQLFGQAFDFAQIELNYRARLRSFVWLYCNKEFDRACIRVHNFVDKFVTKALEFRRAHMAGAAKEKGKYIFMNELALATNDPTQLRSELLSILLAGRDTTAGLLSNTFHVLARRPDIWAKLKSEIDQLEGRRPDYEALRNMKYLRNVLNESLRLYPSVPVNTRFANRNTILPVGGGPDCKSPVFIPRGTMVTYSVYAMHRRKDIYGEDADEYNPDRWEKLRVGWGYLPFNGGPRICVGQQFALTEAGYTIVRMMQEFESIESRDNEKWLESLHLTLSSGNGVLASLFPRK